MRDVELFLKVLGVESLLCGKFFEYEILFHVWFVEDLFFCV